MLLMHNAQLTGGVMLATFVRFFAQKGDKIAESGGAVGYVSVVTKCHGNPQ